MWCKPKELEPGWDSLTLKEMNTLLPLHLNLSPKLNLDIQIFSVSAWPSHGLDEFEYYLLGWSVSVETDHSPLEQIFKKNINEDPTRHLLA